MKLFRRVKPWDPLGDFLSGKPVCFIWDGASYVWAEGYEDNARWFRWKGSRFDPFSRKTILAGTYVDGPWLRVGRRDG